MSRDPGYFYGNAQAVAEGWVLVQLRSGAWRIKRVPARRVFLTDREAYRFVEERANENFSAHYHDAWSLVRSG